MTPIQHEAEDQLDFSEASFVNLMGELHQIKGYRAAAIMTCDGELLYSNATGVSRNNNLTVMMEALNKFFGLACNLTEKSGFDSCGEVSLRTGDEILVIRCSGKDCLVGIRLVVCIEDLGNVALLHRRLEQLLPRIMKCLIWEPDNLVPLYMKEFKGAADRMSPVPAGTAKMTVN